MGKEEQHKAKEREQQKAKTYDNMNDASLASAAGTQMMFVTMIAEECIRLQHPGTEALAQTWKTMMQNAGLNVNIYVMGPGKMMVSSTGWGDPLDVKSFILSQEGVDWFEYQNQKH